MMRPGQIVGLVLSTVIATVLVFAALSAATGTWYEPGQIIVKFTPQVGAVKAETKDGVISVGIATLDEKMSQYKAYHIEPIFPHKSSELAHIYQLDFHSPSDAKTVARDFAGDEHLLYAEPRYIHRTCDSPNDPYFQNGLQWFFNTVHAPDAWNIRHGDPALIIGIVDTGVDYDHPDLSANRWLNYGEDVNGDSVINAIDYNSADDDSNGFKNDFWGWDFGGLGYPDNWPDEGASLHGTHTAGICCAVTNNEVANAGMSWNCKFMAVKVSRDGETNITYGYEGIQYAADNGASVINLSWFRTDEPSAFEQEVIDSAAAKGCILVAAAGNDEPGNAYAPPDTCPLSYPATYNHVTAVAATDIADRASSFTYYGTWVDVSAPGNGIYSNLWDDTYGMRSSTSAACALVSGVAALLKIMDPNMTSDEFQERMHTTSDNIDNLNPSYIGRLGGGRLNAYRALANIVSVEDLLSDAGHVPGDYALSQNYPNPFNSNTSIAYRLKTSGMVELRIYNVKGQLVKTLVNQSQAAGEHMVQWDGSDARGQQVASGIYLYRLKTGSWAQARKMLLVK